MTLHYMKITWKTHSVIEVLSNASTRAQRRKGVALW